LKKARELRPDLIILDVMMPGEGGVPMYRQLRSDPDLASTPVIVLSAVEGRTFAHSLAMMNLGPGPRLPEPEAYIEKPPAPEVLLRKVAAIIGPPVDPPTEPEPGTSSAPSKGPETS
jgi:CheY-like chemotaxis protein